MADTRGVPHVESTAERSPDLGLSTFGGVFTPSILTILGLVLFLRLGVTTGNVGLLPMLLILGGSTAVSVLTTISLSAIATNLKVGGGGVYFIISRTLGPAFGGSIGLVLYLGMSVSVAFYAIGFGEAVAAVIGTTSGAAPRLIAVAAIIALLGIAWLGADIATRAQYVVMACLAAALLAYVIGVANDLEPGRIADSWTAGDDGVGFWVTFALFFPAITGFTQGVAMSGDLRTPSQSIIRGTFLAIGLSTAVYLLVIVSFTMTADLGELRDEPAIMRRLSLHPAFIDVGVISATLSSAIASLMGAPRTLQRLAADRLVPVLEPFAVGAGPANNPRRGVLLSAVIAMITVAIGDLDLVAPIISMFFLASYGLINYATYAEARAASTSFRPTFRFFDWRLSLLGTVGCIGAILAIDPIAGAVAGLLIAALHRYIARTSGRARWADSTRGFHVSEIRNHLHLMRATDDVSRDWRPYTVAFVPRNPGRRHRLVEVANQLEGRAGFTSVVRILVGTGPVIRKRAGEVDVELQRELEHSHPSTFGRVVVADDVSSGVAAVLQAHGIGPLQPNIALFNLAHPSDDAVENAESWGAMIQTARRFGSNVAVLHHDDAATATDRQRLDVWWSDDESGALLVLLAWLMTRTSEWDDADVRVWVERRDDVERPSETLDRVRQLLDEARLPVRVAGSAKAESFAKTVGDASFVLAPMRVRHKDGFGPGGASIADLVRTGVPDTLFVHVSEAVELDVQPDQSQSRHLADAVDRAERLRSHAQELSTTAAGLVVRAETVRLEHDGDDSAPEVAAAAKDAAAAQRAYLDARARAEEAFVRVRSLDPSMLDGELDPEVWLAESSPTRFGFTASETPPR